MGQSISVKSFEEVYKTSYSHGLENIYALEIVDIKTVRRLHDEVKSPSIQPKKSAQPSKQPQNIQTLFNFGMAYKNSIEPFILKEPIHALGLTRYIENNLLGQGKKVLGDLLNQPLSGFGQGHIDEIQHRLKEYLGGRHLSRANSIDFTAWLKAIVGDLEKKKLFVALEPYGLEQHVHLTAGESIELRRLTLEKKLEWREEAAKQLRTDAKKQQMDQDFWEVSEVFIKPWMGWRHGIATEIEVLEKMQKLSEDSSSVQAILDFFKETYFKGAFPLNRHLEPLDVGLFASTGWIATQYDLVTEKALTYFYKNTSFYPLDTLIGYLEREFAKEWIGFPEGFLSIVLKKCPLLYPYKNSSGILHVRLA